MRMTPPGYGSPEFRALPPGDRRRAEAIIHAAECWRLLCASPHVAELLAEWVEWDRRRQERESSHAISAAEDWRKEATVPTYTELERRRNSYTTEPLTPAQIRARAHASWAALETKGAA